MEKIIASTNWSRKDGINVSMRLILVEIVKRSDLPPEFVSTFERGDDHGRFMGHYTTKLVDALQEFLNRYKIHNLDYPDGNVSHLPGIAYIRYSSSTRKDRV